VEHKTRIRRSQVYWAQCNCGWEGSSRMLAEIAEGDAERHHQRVKAATDTAEKEHSHG